MARLTKHDIVELQRRLQQGTLTKKNYRQVLDKYYRGGPDEDMVDVEEEFEGQLIIMRRTVCVYCYGPGGGADHVPALAHVYKRLVTGADCLNVDLLIVSVCNACNTALGGKPLLTLEDRRAYIHAQGISTPYAGRIVRMMSFSEVLEEDWGY